MSESLAMFLVNLWLVPFAYYGGKLVKREEDWGRESTQYLAEKGIDITKTEYSQLTANAY